MNEAEYKIRNLESSILYLQTEHANTLQLLHAEIKTLQMRNSEISFEMAMKNVLPEMKDPTDAVWHSSGEAEGNLVNRAAAGKALQNEQESEIADMRKQLQLMHESQQSQLSGLQLQLRSKSDEIRTLSTQLQQAKRTALPRMTQQQTQTASPPQTQPSDQPVHQKTEQPQQKKAVVVELPGAGNDRTTISTVTSSLTTAGSDGIFSVEDVTLNHKPAPSQPPTLPLQSFPNPTKAPPNLQPPIVPKTFKFRNQVSVHPESTHIRRRPIIARQAMISTSVPVKSGFPQRHHSGGPANNNRQTAAIPQYGSCQEERANTPRSIRKPSVLPPISPIKICSRSPLGLHSSLHPHLHQHNHQQQQQQLGDSTTTHKNINSKSPDSNTNFTASATHSPHDPEDADSQPEKDRIIRLELGHGLLDLNNSALLQHEQ